MAMLRAIGKFFVGTVALVGGVATGGVASLFLQIYRWIKGWTSDRRHLNSIEIQVMKPFFPTLDLEKVRLFENSWLPAPLSRIAMVLGSDVYCGRSFRLCSLDRGASDARLLAHELVHVRQQEGGLFPIFCVLYAANLLTFSSGVFTDYEGEAEDFGDQNREEIEEQRIKACAAEEVLRTATES
jgi:hypothetical protein